MAKEIYLDKIEREKEEKMNKYSKKLILRPYQNESLDEIEASIAFGSTNIILSATTSFGKAAIIAGICERYSYKNIVIMVNIESLIDQIANTLKDLNINYSILKSGRELDFNEKYRINLIMAQTYYSRMDNNNINIKSDILIRDEIHIEYDTKRTKKILKDLNPDITIGLTATPYSSSGFKLKNADIIYGASSLELTKMGYLSPLKFYVPKWAEKIDYSKVKKSGSDYSMISLDKIIGTNKHIENIINSMNQINAKNKKTLIFASTIELCNKLNNALLKEGYRSEVYHSENSTKENERILNAFKNNSEYVGKDDEINNFTLFDNKKTKKYISTLISVSKLTTGFSVNDIDLGVLVSKTAVRSKYVQIGGRMKRTYNRLNELIEKYEKHIKRN